MASAAGVRIDCYRTTSWICCVNANQLLQSCMTLSANRLRVTMTVCVGRWYPYLYVLRGSQSENPRLLNLCSTLPLTLYPPIRLTPKPKRRPIHSTSHVTPAEPRSCRAFVQKYGSGGIPRDHADLCNLAIPPNPYPKVAHQQVLHCWEDLIDPWKTANNFLFIFSQMLLPQKRTQSFKLRIQ